MGRTLALDPGTKRIGIALSDELGWTAQPLETYLRRSLDADIGHIKQLVDQHDVQQVLIGFPFHMNGQPGSVGDDRATFQGRLTEALPVPVIPWDERLTTRAAERLLIEANMSRKKRKGVVDRVAAAILLQSYLDSPAQNTPDTGYSDPNGHECPEWEQEP